MKNKTDEEILSEARAALEPALRVHAEAFAHDVRSKLRREFPFGPEASRRERHLWHELVKETVMDLKKWAWNITLIACLFVFLAPPALGAENNELQEVQIVDQQGKPFAVAAPATYEPPPKSSKKPFAMRHPKLHKLGRKTRKLCQIGKPVVDFAGSCAQIFIAITKRR